MKVHVIYQRPEADRILPRLANMLLSETYFTGSDTPDNNADINLFFPYLELWRFRNFKATPIFAWFTHYDLAQPEKIKIWEYAATKADMRLTSALKYKKMLDHYGPTFLVTPPLELSKFKPKG